jgi:hypothetical protein
MEEHVFWDCKLYNDQNVTVMDILSEKCKKEYLKSLTELIRPEEKEIFRVDLTIAALTCFTSIQLHNTDIQPLYLWSSTTRINKKIETLNFCRCYLLSSSVNCTVADCIIPMHLL